MLQRRGGDSLLSKSLPLAQRSLRDCRWRVCTPALLMKLKGFGEKTAGVSSAGTWPRCQLPQSWAHAVVQCRQHASSMRAAAARMHVGVWSCMLAFALVSPSPPPPCRSSLTLCGRTAGPTRRTRRRGSFGSSARCVSRAAACWGE
jgi:hypothetical protein